MKDPTQAPELKRFILPALFVGALFVTLFMRRPDVSTDQRIITFQGPIMGTTYTVKVISQGLENKAQSEVDQAIISTLESVNSSMSTYLRSSELSKFNDHLSLSPFPASDEILRVMSEAKRVAKLSNGAFDVTVGPLVDAWGFGPEKTTTPPTPGQIELLRESIGYEKLKIGDEHLSKTAINLRCDLSAIAKGFGVDKVRDTLEQLGFKNFMIEVGGEVITKGRRLDGRIWRIGIEKPDPSGVSIQRAIELDSMAMASSGDYRNYREIDGKRVSHTIDPRTGSPVTHRLASVTVLHKSCMTADALATTLSVLGPEEGMQLANKSKIHALFLVRTPEGGFMEKPSSAFKALFSE